jgi:hypothetical protein
MDITIKTYIQSSGGESGRSQNLMSNNIFFQLWNPTGMINQVMSLELAVGLAHETQKNMVIHYVSNAGAEGIGSDEKPIYTPSRLYNNQRKFFINENKHAHISDILDWNSDMVLIDEKVDKFKEESLVINNLTNEYYYSNSKNISELEMTFAEGRSRLEIIDNIHLKGTLGWYSRFFFNRSKSLDKELSLVKFKKEYSDFADLVAKSLGDFVGGHIRLSDHTHMFNTEDFMFDDGLKILESYKLLIVISTDEPNNPIVYNSKHRFILLDEYIINNFSDEFYKLPIQDEVVFGLICNLVMCKSLYFIGTSGSTYTGYIQRLRNQNNLNETWSFWDNPEDTSSGPYSWNGYDLHNIRKMFWREWKESRLDI